MVEYTIRQNWVDYSATKRNPTKSIANCAFQRFLDDYGIDGEYCGLDFDVAGYRVAIVVKPIDCIKTSESFSMMPAGEIALKRDIYVFSHFLNNKVIFYGWVSYDDFWSKEVTMYSKDTAFYPDNQLKDFEQFELLFIPH